MKTLLVLAGLVVGFVFLCFLALTRDLPKSVARPQTTATSAQAQPRGSQWVGGETEPSKMDDSKGASYEVRAQADIKGWLTTYRPVLVARCNEGSPDFFIHIGTAAKPELGEYNKYTVETRWDEEKATSAMWSPSTDDQSLFAPNPTESIRHLVKAKRLRLRFTPFNADPAIAEFDVSGFGDDRLNKIAQACHWEMRSGGSGKHP